MSSDAFNDISDEIQEFIVSRESAILPGYDKRGLPVNHFQLNKFSKPDDGYYIRVKVVIVDMVKNALVLPDNCKVFIFEMKIFTLLY
jgi:hypothetical protein